MDGRRTSPGTGGFTLMELLIALTIMSAAMTVVIASFVATMKGWKKGGQLLNELHHGDFVMEQLVSALRSTAFFHTAPEFYGFQMEDQDKGRYPADFISFVTSGTAFIPVGSPLANGLHRLEMTIDDDEDGNPAVSVRAIPHLTDPKDWEEDPWFVSSEVKGLDVRFYNLDQEDWEDEWKDTNAVPSLVEVTLFMDPLEKGGDPYTISRVVEIPVSPVVAQAVRFREEDRVDLEAVEGDEPEGGDEAAGPVGSESGDAGDGSGRSEP